MSRAALTSPFALAFAFAFAGSLCACGATDEQLRARAAFDMSCPQEQLHLIRIDDRTQGVSGCGQKATYVESCGHVDGYGGKHDCTWVLNTDSHKAKPTRDVDDDGR